MAWTKPQGILGNRCKLIASSTGLQKTETNLDFFSHSVAVFLCLSRFLSHTLLLGSVYWENIRQLELELTKWRAMFHLFSHLIAMCPCEIRNKPQLWYLSFLNYKATLFFTLIRYAWQFSSYFFWERLAKKRNVAGCLEEQWQGVTSNA